MDLPTPEQSARLDAYGLDAESRRQLAQLLAHGDSTGHSFEFAVLEEIRLWSHASQIEAGATVGRFTVVRRLGEGGSGEVYLVNYLDEAAPRQAALKLLRFPDSAFWDRERRLLARVSHPYIATLLESGTLPSGRNYLLMEYIEGQRLDRFLETLPWKQRVPTLLKVCEAVSALHRQFVLHRDLKPANILITPDGFPKLVDFGISQAEDSAEPAIAAASRAYASPEQLDGAEPTAASDIFSLGRILERSLPAEAPPDLKSIANKATNPRPELRYETVADLHGDLARWQAQRPVTAYRSSWVYHAACFFRRHRWSSLATAAALIVAAVALGFGVQQYREARQRFADLRELASVAIFDLDEAIRDLPGALAARAKVADTAFRYLAALEAASQSDASLRAELADAYVKVGMLESSFSGASLERFADPFAKYLKSLALRDSLGQAQSRDPKVRYAYLSLLDLLTARYRTRMRIKESEAMLDRLRPLAEAWIREEPSSPEAVAIYLYYLDEESRRFRRQGKQPALENQRKLVALLPRYKALVGDSPRYWQAASDGQRLMGGLAGELGLYEESQTAFDASLEAARAWYRAKPTIASARAILLTQSEAIYLGLSANPRELGKPARLLADYAQTLAGVPDPEATMWNSHRCELFSLRGHIAIAAGRGAEASRHFTDAREAVRKATADGKPALWAGLLLARMAEREAQFRQTGH
jgi:serine/threonine protein kinase